MKRLEVEHQFVLRSHCVAALLAHVQLVAPLFVGVLQGDAVDLLHVGLQGAALGEGLVAQAALVGADACMKRLKGHDLAFIYYLFVCVCCTNMRVCIYLYVCVRVS